MREITLFFIKNVTQDEWVGSPLQGAEAVDWPDAHPYISPGDALSVMEQLARRARADARSLRARVAGFLAREVPEADVFTIVPLTLDEPSQADIDGEDDDEGEGAFVNAVGREAGEPDEEDDDFYDEVDTMLTAERERGFGRYFRDIGRYFPVPWGFPREAR